MIWQKRITYKNMLSATLTFAQTHDCDITEEYVDWGNNINFILMRDQNLSPPLNNTLIGIITSTFSSWGIKICHPLWPLLNGVITSTLSSWGINLSPPLNNTLIGIITSTFSSWGIKICHPLWPLLLGVITSTLSSWGITICHPLWTIRWLG